MLPKMIYPLKHVDNHDVASVGAVGAALGEMHHAGFPIPDGFIISSDAYKYFLSENQLVTKINHLIGTITFEDAHSILQVSTDIQRIIRHAAFPDDLAKTIVDAYTKVSSIHEPPVHIRTSLTFDEQHSHGLFIQKGTSKIILGDVAVLEEVKSLWASLFEARSLFYRHEKKLDHFRFSTAVVVQEALPYTISGYIYTVNPQNHDKKTMLIEAKYGLLGQETNQELDRYITPKDSHQLLNTFIAEQTHKNERVGNEIHVIKVPEAETQKQKLTDQEMLRVIDLGTNMEQHYYYPLEITYGIYKGVAYVLSLKAQTLHPIEDSNEIPSITAPGANGVPLTKGIASGHIRVIEQPQDLDRIVPGEIIVIKEVTEDSLPKLKRAYGIISEKATYHPEMVHLMNAFGYPVIAGVPHALKTYKNSSVWTLNATTGQITAGGLLRTAHTRQSKQSVQATATKLFLEIHSEHDFKNAPEYPSDGIGLLDGSALIKSIGIHPKKGSTEQNAALKEALIAKLEPLVRSFSPRLVLYRLSDLTTGEYQRLSGGKTYESNEENPFLGYRGATRAIHDPASIMTEIRALHEIRDTHGLQNLGIILPFVRTSHELSQILALLQQTGITKAHTFKIWLSIDTPAQTIMIDTFLKDGIDGVHINAHSLSVLFSGADPLNSDVSSLVDEESNALLSAYQYIIKRAIRHGIPSMITGRTVVHSHIMLEKLIHWGVSGIVVKPDGIENLRKTIYNYERKFIS